MKPKNKPQSQGHRRRNESAGGNREAKKKGDFRDHADGRELRNLS